MPVVPHSARRWRAKPLRAMHRPGRVVCGPSSSALCFWVAAMSAEIVPFPEQVEAEHEQSDDTLALRFIDAHQSHAEVEAHALLRWVELRGRWYRYVPKGLMSGRWVLDETRHVWDMVRQCLRIEGVQLGLDAKQLKPLLANSKVYAVEHMARSDRRVAGHPSEFDADTMALNTLGGMVDLRTGEVSKPFPSTLCTKQAQAKPKGDCPRWKQFLHEVTGGDVEFQRYLQRVAGYCLTGETREHAVFFVYGPGGNGKSVFSNTLAYVMGDYARSAPMSTFVASNNDKHPTDLAMLAGARLVVTGETEHGQRWAEAKLKQLTGGDTITARFQRQDFFEYKPQLKLLATGNTQPELRSVDAAMRRRLQLIPFTLPVPPERMDKQLEEKLRAEADGILAWAIEGCLEWQRLGGLGVPEVVRVASENYFEEQDSLQEWLSDCCDVGAAYRELPGELFASWQKWAEKAGEFTGTKKALGQKLEQAGFAKARANGVKWRSGLRVKPGQVSERDF